MTLNDYVWYNNYKATEDSYMIISNYIGSLNCDGLLAYIIYLGVY